MKRFEIKAEFCLLTVTDERPNLAELMKQIKLVAKQYAQDNNYSLGDVLVCAVERGSLPE